MTIAVATYNSKPEELYATLFSAASQVGVDLQIIVTDDGSASFDPGLVSKWLDGFGVENYKILASPVNRGTTMNVLESVRAATGEYYKGISPGDVLYSGTCILEAISFMVEEGCEVCFGDAVYYLEGDSATILNMANPTCLAPYDKRDRERIRRHYLQYHQFALGASFMCRTDLLLRYMPLLEGRVKYCEDFSFALMVLDGIELRHWRGYLLWYQYGSGISTSGSQLWRERMKADDLAVEEIARELDPGVKWGIDMDDIVGRAARKLFVLRSRLFRKLGIWRKPRLDDSFFRLAKERALEVKES